MSKEFPANHLLFTKYIDDIFDTTDGYVLQQRFPNEDISWNDYLNYKRFCLDSADAVSIGKLIAEIRCEDRTEAFHWARYLIAMYKSDLIHLIEWHSGLERRIVVNQIRRA